MSEYGGYQDNALVAELYDVFYDDQTRPKDIEFFVDYSKLSGGRTLELGCGTGRVLIPTAAAGCEITGLDQSAYMLNKCRIKLAEESEDLRERVRLIQGNMIDFKTGETYSLVTVPFRPFQHILSTEDQRACLNCINDHLEPNGRCIIDVFNPDPARLIATPMGTDEIEDAAERELPDGRKVRRTGRMAAYHWAQQYNDVELIYYVSHPTGGTERLVQAFPMRYFFRYELEYLLELCGFKVVELFGDFNKSPFVDDSPEIIFIAEKK